VFFRILTLHTPMQIVVLDVSQDTQVILRRVATQAVNYVVKDRQDEYTYSNILT